MTEINTSNNNKKNDSEVKTEVDKALSLYTSSARYASIGRVGDIITARRRGSRVKNFASNSEASSTFTTSRARSGRQGATVNRYLRRFDFDKNGQVSDKEALDFINRAIKYGNKRGLASLFHYNENAKGIYESLSKAKTVKKPDSLESKLNRLDSQGVFDLLPGAEANDLLQALILTRAEIRENPDEVFVGIGMDLLASEKMKVIEKVTSAKERLAEEGISFDAAVKHLSGISSDEGYAEINKNLEAHLLLEKRFDQVSLGGTEGVMDHIITEQTHFGLLLEISDIHETGLQPEQIKEMIENKNLRSNKIISEIIDAYSDAGKLELFKMGGSESRPLSKWDVQAFQGIIAKHSGIKGELKVYDAKHEDVLALVRDMIHGFKIGDEVILAKTQKDILLELAHVYGEEFEVKNTGTTIDLVAEENSFIEALVRGSVFDASILTPGEEGPRVSFENLQALEAYLSSVRTNPKLSSADLISMHDRRLTMSFVDNRMLELNMTTLAEEHNNLEFLLTSLSIGNEDGKYLPELREYLEKVEGLGDDFSKVQLSPEILGVIRNHANEIKGDDGKVLATIDGDYKSVHTAMDYQHLSSYKKNQKLLSAYASKLQNGEQLKLEQLLLETASIFGDYNLAGEYDGITGLIHKSLIKRDAKLKDGSVSLSQDDISYIRALISKEMKYLDSLEHIDILTIDKDPQY